MVHPVQGNLIIPPTCTEYTSGVNKGKCRSSLPTQSSYNCGNYGTIPLSYIGVREVCTSYHRNSSCTLQGPNGVGLPNADYLLFVSASSSTCKLTLVFIIIILYNLRSRYSFMYFLKCTVCQLQVGNPMHFIVI